MSSDSPHIEVKRFKIILIGDSGVGKTSLLHRFNKGEYDGSLTSTIGVAFNTKKMWIDGGSGAIILELWDTAGQERFDAIIPRYFRGAQVIMAVFDMSNYKTVESLKKRWLQKIHDFSIDGHPVIAIVGNKSDLIPAKDQIKSVGVVEDLIDQYTRKLHLPIISYFTSAKSGENVQQLFEEIAMKVYKRNTMQLEDIELYGDSPSKRKCC